MKDKKIIKEDIKTLESIKKQFVKKGKLKYIEAIEDDIKYLKEMLKKEGK